MKNYLSIVILLFLGLSLNAQAPQGFNYQATVRNSSGDLIFNTNVYFKFNVIQGSQTAVPIFTETHYVPTDDLGQVNLVIGQGTATTGTFSALDWSLGSYYLGIELDTGNGYVAMGTTQLLSVPYALYSENSGNSTPTTPNLEAVLAENNSANNQQIKDLQDPTEAQDAVTKAYADALSTSQGLMNFNDWTNYQIWSDFTAMEIETNSFVFINAYSPTLILPSNPSEMDVIYIYTTRSDGYNYGNSLINFGANGNSITVTGSNTETTTSQTDNYISGRFSETGLQTLIFVGSQWFVSNFYYEGMSNIPGDFDGDGFSEADGDCNPFDANVYPGATEICDGFDNNCDGEVDEGFEESTWYPDYDQDGYGNMYDEGILTNCPPDPDFWVNNNEDCDDSFPDINPGTEEVADSIDNNCNGLIDEGLTTVTDIDGNIYQTANYGNQEWTIENYNVANYADGTPIPEVTDPDEWINLTTGAWQQVEQTMTADGTTFTHNSDKLYNWYAVMGIHDNDPNTPNKQFAPDGWHVPTNEDWTTLENFLISNGYNYDETTTGNKIAKSMASTDGWFSYPAQNVGYPAVNPSLNNSSAFNAYPDGIINDNGAYYLLGEHCWFWTSTESSAENSISRRILNGTVELNSINHYKYLGESVRLVKD